MRPRGSEMDNQKSTVRRGGVECAKEDRKKEKTTRRKEAEETSRKPSKISSTSKQQWKEQLGLKEKK